MKSCLKPTPPQSPGPEPRQPVARPTPHKSVSFNHDSLEEVYIVDDWDRTPAPAARRLTYADMLELKQIRLSLPRAEQPPDTHSYFPTVLSAVPVKLLPLLPASTPPPTSAATMAMVSPTAAPPSPSAERIQSPSPPSTPPPIPAAPARKFNMAFLPLLDASSSPPASYPSAPSTPSILSVTPPSPLQGESSCASEENDREDRMPDGGSNHLPTPDASPLRATSPLATPDDADFHQDVLTPSTLRDFPAPPDTLPMHSLSTPELSSSTSSPSPRLISPASTSSPSPDSHPSLHSYFHIRLGLPAHIQNTSAGAFPDSPFVDPLHDRSPGIVSSTPVEDRPAEFVAQAQAASTVTAFKLQGQRPHSFLRGVPSPTLVPPSPFSLSPNETTDGATKQLGRMSSLRRTAFAESEALADTSPEPAPAPPKKQKKKEYMMINDMLVEVDCDDSDEEEEEERPAEPAPVSPREVPLPPSPMRA